MIHGINFPKIKIGEVRDLTELKERLELCFKDRECDIQHKGQYLFHMVYLPHAPALRAEFQRLEAMFSHTKEKASITKVKSMMFFVGDEEVRYKFISQETLTSHGYRTSNCYVIRETLMKYTSNKYCSCCTTMCDMKDFLIAAIIIEAAGFTQICCDETILGLPFEEPEYRYQRMHEDYDYNEKNHQFLVDWDLYWIDLTDPNQLSDHQTAMAHYMTSPFLIKEDVSDNLEYSDWGAWIKINQGGR